MENCNILYFDWRDFTLFRLYLITLNVSNIKTIDTLGSFFRIFHKADNICVSCTSSPIIKGKNLLPSEGEGEKMLSFYKRFRPSSFSWTCIHFLNWKMTWCIYECYHIFRVLCLNVYVYFSYFIQSINLWMLMATSSTWFGEAWFVFLENRELYKNNLLIIKPHGEYWFFSVHHENTPI